MLRFALRDIACAALLGSLVACSSSGIDREGFQSSAFCTDETSKLEALRNSLGAEWVALVSGGQIVSEAGTHCDCTALLETTKNDLGLHVGQAGGMVLIVKRGDDIRTARTREDLVAALGAIDSPEKAHFVLWAHGYDVGCDRWFKTTADGFEVIGEIVTADCDPIVTEEHRVAVRRDATIAVLEREELSRKDGVCIGRRPAGLVESAARANEGSTRGAWFARAAQLEAASVDAFRILARELVTHGAPPDLVFEAERSARDEIRHAAIMARIARRFGASFEAPVVEPRPDRSLFDIARENAVEGCVRETYGAVEAMVLAELETDPAIARALAAIAKDETRHAELSWKVAAWARTKLRADELSAIDDAMEEAVNDLARDVPGEGPTALAMGLLKDRLWALTAESRSR